MGLSGGDLRCLHTVVIGDVKRSLCADISTSDLMWHVHRMMLSGSKMLLEDLQVSSLPQDNYTMDTSKYKSLYLSTTGHLKKSLTMSSPDTTQHFKIPLDTFGHLLTPLKPADTSGHL